jgi:hypothetical protein
MTKEQAFQILLSVYPSLRLNEQERQSVLKAYEIIEQELGLKKEDDKKKK